MTNEILLDKILNYTERLLDMKVLCHDDKQCEFVFDSLIRAATTMGATFSDLMFPVNKADFVLKLQIALKKAAETEYWLKLFAKVAKIPSAELKADLDECLELKKIFMASIAASKTGKQPESKVIVKTDACDDSFKS